MKAQRFFLCDDVDSYVSLSVPSSTDYGMYELKLNDCGRTIHWEFYIGGSTAAERKRKRKESLKKLTKFRNLINELYAELGGE